MNEQILITLKRKLDDLSVYGEVDAETRRNALKEELQFYVLNFIYHHPEYSRWIMYGGSALRICHGLDRMSVDLDFEVADAITEKFLSELKAAIEKHFSGTYGAQSDFLTIKITAGRGLTLKFTVGEELSIGHSSKQVHVKIDLNHFTAQKTVTEARPMNRDQLSFVIITYNMSALMASKIAAIFLRGTRGVDKNIYEYKGRDIYDLLWYMSKKAVPDLDYLAAKNVDIKDLRTLFDTLTTKILNYEKMDALLKEDLTPLFLNQTYIENWLKNWRESYLQLLNEYKINTVTTLERIDIHGAFDVVFSFTYWFKTEGGRLVRIEYSISGDWIIFHDGDLTTEINKNISDTAMFTSTGRSTASQEKLKQYVTLFYQKTEDYFKKTNRVMLGDSITTKLIRNTTENLDYKKEKFIIKSALLSCELEDLLK